MDYHIITAHWEEEINGIDNNRSCSLLRSLVPVSEQVS